MTKIQPQDLSKDLDQYYTNPKYAEAFLSIISDNIDINSANILLEPSAGSGSFYSLLDPSKRVGLDLDPKYPGIINQNFFEYEPPADQNIITIGNPPFGKNANLAVKFFNHAAKFSSAICFIIPRTFRKASVINRLHKNFHLIYDETVPDNSFLFNNKEYDVWCCAQIWIKKDTKREKIPTVKLSQIQPWFEIVSPDYADFAIQRVGGRAGLIRTENYKTYSSQSHYFIKANKPDVLDIFKNINFEAVKYNTAGNPSISPSELIELFIASGTVKNVNIQLLPEK